MRGRIGLYIPESRSSKRKVATAHAVLVSYVDCIVATVTWRDVTFSVVCMVEIDKE